MAKENKSIGREIFEWAYSIVIAVIIAFLIKGFLFDIVKVDGQSMMPTLHHNDRLIVTKLGYDPKQGDIVILDAHYNAREAYFDAVAKSEGKDDLSSFREVTEGFKLPDELKKVYYVKRIIATEGQTVDIKDGKVYVDGEELAEPYFDGQTFATDSMVHYPFTVSEDCVFVMGDNRGNSTDSRSSRLGEVDEDAIMGKSQIRIFPFNSIGTTK
ncbi:MAG: signal peptidase I [Clostridia bacterium]|nr:signal peptidase I [Clostridia bacterium]